MTISGKQLVIENHPQVVKELPDYGTSVSDSVVTCHLSLFDSGVRDLRDGRHDLLNSLASHFRPFLQQVAAMDDNRGWCSAGSQRTLAKVVAAAT